MTFEIPDELVGRTIVVMPFANSPTRAVSPVLVDRFFGSNEGERRLSHESVGAYAEGRVVSSFLAAAARFRIDKDLLWNPPSERETL